jgi:hypothetical protein
MQDSRLDELSIFVHGTLAGLHLLGIVYNLKRRNHWDVLAHGCAAAYDLYAVGVHLRALDAAKRPFITVSRPE